MVLWNVPNDDGQTSTFSPDQGLAGGRAHSRVGTRSKRKDSAVDQFDKADHEREKNRVTLSATVAPRLSATRLSRNKRTRIAHPPPLRPTIRQPARLDCSVGGRERACGPRREKCEIGLLGPRSAARCGVGKDGRTGAVRRRLSCFPGPERRVALERTGASEARQGKRRHGRLGRFPNNHHLSSQNGCRSPPHCYQGQRAFLSSSSAAAPDSGSGLRPAYRPVSCVFAVPQPTDVFLPFAPTRRPSCSSSPSLAHLLYRLPRSLASPGPTPPRRRLSRSAWPSSSPRRLNSWVPIFALYTPPSFSSLSSPLIHHPRFLSSIGQVGPRRARLQVVRRVHRRPGLRVSVLALSPMASGPGLGAGRSSESL